MSRLHGSLSARLKALKDQVGWMVMVLTDRDGRPVRVPATPVIDAYLHLMGHEGDLEGAGLEPSLVATLSRIPVRASMSDMEAGVVRAAKQLVNVPTGVPAPSDANPPEGEVVV